MIIVTRLTNVAFPVEERESTEESSSMKSTRLGAKAHVLSSL